jgi:DUF4097 and DUF4098 domain-containing protein YvlB
MPDNWKCPYCATNEKKYQNLLTLAKNVTDLNDAELIWTSKMLKMYVEELSNRTSNDFRIANTPDNLRMVQDMRKTQTDPMPIHISSDGSGIYIMDWELAGYLAVQITEYAKAVKWVHDTLERM